MQAKAQTFGHQALKSRSLNQTGTLIYSRTKENSQAHNQLTQPSVITQFYNFNT